MTTAIATATYNPWIAAWSELSSAKALKYYANRSEEDLTTIATLIVFTVMGASTVCRFAYGVAYLGWEWHCAARKAIVDLNDKQMFLPALPTLYLMPAKVDYYDAADARMSDGSQALTPAPNTPAQAPLQKSLLFEKTVVELRTMCRERKISYTGKDRKHNLIAYLSQA